MKGMSRTVITSIVREERLIAHIDNKHTYCRYEHKKTTTTVTMITDDKERTNKKKAA